MSGINQKLIIDRCKIKDESPDANVWNDFCITETHAVKQVTFGNKFTAIGQMSQVRRMTEKFGLFGRGWGVDPSSEVFEFHTVNEKVMVMYRANIFYMLDGERHLIPIATWSPAVTSKGIPDDKAIKAVRTDALTKGLSQLGMNADVFMGMYDSPDYQTALAQRENLLSAKNYQKAKLEIVEGIVVKIDKVINQALSLPNPESAGKLIDGFVNTTLNNLCFSADLEQEEYHRYAQSVWDKYNSAINKQGGE